MSGSLLSDQNKGISAFLPEPLDRNKNKAGEQRALDADVAERVGFEPTEPG